MKRPTTPSHSSASDSESSAIAGGSKAVPIARKWSWHYRELARLMDRLISECRDRRAEDSHPLEHHHFNLADCASDEADHDVRRADSSNAQETLSEVEAALKRIVAGTYGICEKTGVAIDAARLRAIPWTRFTKEAEQQLEETGLLRRPHLGSLGSVRSGPTRGVGAIDSDEEDTPEAADETLREITSKRSVGLSDQRNKATVKPVAKKASRTSKSEGNL